MKELKDTHIFITGGAGFIGSKLATLLMNNNKVTIFDNLHNNALKNLKISEHPNLNFVQGDILDLECLSAAMEDDVEYIVHCAAIAGVDTVINNPHLTMEVNLIGVFNICKAARKLKKLKRLVEFSTSEVFGSKAYNVDEFSISPTVSVGEARWTYSISKLAGEFVAHSYHTKFDLPVVTVRPFNIYGPNQVGVGAIHNFTVAALKGEDLVIHDDGSQIRAWCYVDDFVDGIMRVLVNNNTVGKSYNIGNPRSTVTTYSLAKMVIEVCNSSSKLSFKEMNFSDVALRIPNINSARNDLDFEPKVELQEGLKYTAAWYSQKLGLDV